MSSPWKRKQPEAVADKVLKRAEVSKMARKLQNRLALAHFKAKNGWEDLALDVIEPKVEEQLRRKRASSSGDVLSDSSSSTSDFQYPRALLSSSPLKGSFFSDAIDSGSSGSGHRKRTYYASLQHPSSISGSRKRSRGSPAPGRTLQSNHTAWKDHHQLAQSSPIKPRKQSHFTTTSGPNISFFRGTTSELPENLNPTSFVAGSEEEDDLLPMHSFKMSAMDIRSSPPRTPPPLRSRANLGRRSNGKGTNGKTGEEGADLLLYLATSPSPAHPTTKARMHPPSTPPPRHLALPSSMMTTPGGGGLLGGFGAPNTPSQNFDFSDFVNITPSPAQNAWKTPGTVRTPLTVARRRLTFENFLPSNSSPGIGSHGSGSSSKHTGLGMELGGELIS